MGTLAGHPEAGRITFGVPQSAGEVIFHIRSRARSATMAKLVGFLVIGEAMQTNTWTDFINHTAASVGGRIPDAIQADTKGSTIFRKTIIRCRHLRSWRLATDGRMAAA